MATILPFTPNTAGTVIITVAASSATVALNKGGNNQQVYVQSLAGNAIAFIEFGSSAVTVAAASGMPILPGQRYCFTVGATQTHIATIGTVANTLYVTSGQGLTP